MIQNPQLSGVHLVRGLQVGPLTNGTSLRLRNGLSRYLGTRGTVRS